MNKKFCDICQKDITSHNARSVTIKEAGLCGDYIEVCRDCVNEIRKAVKKLIKR